MVSIHVNGKDISSQISDWKIRWDDKQEALQLICYFPSKKPDTYVHQKPPPRSRTIDIGN